MGGFALGVDLKSGFARLRHLGFPLLLTRDTQDQPREKQPMRKAFPLSGKTC
jgi:hypothetical protein